MLYLATPPPPERYGYYAEHNIGVMNSPRCRRVVPDEWPYWAADNGCFTSSWDADDWWRWLEGLTTDRCLFATAPDALGDHQATLDLWNVWHHRIRSLGFPAAFVIQNGCTVDGVPWGELDWIFVGGDDAYKLGEDAEEIVRHAVRHGIPVHVGRVNGRRRFVRFASMGATSADGTCTAFDPPRIRRVVRWMRDGSVTRDLFFEPVEEGA